MKNKDVWPDKVSLPSKQSKTSPSVTVFYRYPQGLHADTEGVTLPDES